MRKILPVIIVLISFSLLGIILIQVSWIHSQVIAREELYKENLKMVIQQVGEELVQESRPLSLPHAKKFELGLSGDMRDFYHSYSVSGRFTPFEIKEKLTHAFEKKKMKNIHFEFAVASEGFLGTYSIKSAHFLEMASDTTHNLLVVYPLIAGGGSYLENLAPEEALAIVVPDIKSVVLKSLNGMIAGAIIFTVIIITAFYLTLSTILRQKKLSEMKTDFINNMTHELKTPLATISLAIDALRTEKVQQDKSRFLYFTDVIKEENKRMNRHVETILQAAQMEKQETKLPETPIHIHGIIQKVVANLQLQIQEKNGTLELQLDAADDHLFADENHFSNMMNNLVDNAIKYSKPDSLWIRIATKSFGKNGIRIIVEDQGIGMKKENLSRIFEKFYRAHTGNVHNVKGFGLGLSYVKAMTETYLGKIQVDSVAGKGSVFTLSFPRDKQPTT